MARDFLFTETEHVQIVPAPAGMRPVVVISEIDEGYEILGPFKVLLIAVAQRVESIRSDGRFENYRPASEKPRYWAMPTVEFEPCGDFEQNLSISYLLDAEYGEITEDVPWVSSSNVRYSRDSAERDIADRNEVTRKYGTKKAGVDDK